LPEGHNVLRQNKKIRCEKIKILGLRPYPPLGGRKVKIKVKRRTLEAPPPNLRWGENLPPDPRNSFNLKKRGGGTERLPPAWTG
ncbi:MAG: hypothetical protein HW380_3594, partial [Magnetococcales bacterium]|nr:hypothetical protein [Magnetococcales bacterium]